MFSKSSISLFLFVFCFLSIGTIASAGTLRFCTTWRSKFVDAGHGEDYFWSSDFEDRTAKYSLYQVRKKSNNALVKSGILDSKGCTPYFTVSNNTAYKFRQGTKLERGTRKIVITGSKAKSCTSSHIWMNSYYTTGKITGSYTKNLTPNWYGPQSNLAVIAQKSLQYYKSREFPYNQTLYIWPKNWTTSYYNGGNCIRIDTNFTQFGSSMDHSSYKFIVGHEIGHYQSSKNGGPIAADYEAFEAKNKRCNCKHFDEYDEMCIQSKELTGTAQSEAWAYFYAAAIFNARDYRDCKMSYWRAMYNSDGVLDNNPPVTVNCDYNPKWMEKWCSSKMAGKAVMQDWLAFYWDVWTESDNKCTFDKMTDVYETANGLEWIDLGWGAYGTLNATQYNHWVAMGARSGVDH